VLIFRRCGNRAPHGRVFVRETSRVTFGARRAGLVARAGKAGLAVSGQLDLRQWYDVKTLRMVTGRLSAGTCDRLRPLQAWRIARVSARRWSGKMPGGIAAMFAASPDEPFRGRPMTAPFQRQDRGTPAERCLGAGARGLDFHTGQGDSAGWRQRP